ncbi:serine hydrolase [Pseudidiomarina sp. CB1]|uniref:serine hydrolase domain-containing protein n=1 Tax=Pseudidiomarina sp. CB1 TaxID=2972484 RepID=UPI0021625130|nr:serine hydrolase [Pseudidiomarina sp. CB1]
MRRTSMTTLSSALLALSALPISNATETETTENAYAAGYLAGFTCSAVFNGNKEISAIRRDELTGIYSLVADKVQQLQPEINRDHRYVRVTYDEGQRARISVWRPKLGCVDLPVGASIKDLAKVANPFADALASGSDDGAPWAERPLQLNDAQQQALTAVIDRAFGKAYGSGARTSAVLVVSPEHIIAEKYQTGFTPETAQRTWSVAKSIGASVIGAAVQQRLLELDEPAGIENWSHDLDPRRAITLENLLHMASGLDSNKAGNRTDRVYMGGGLVSDTATESALEVTPGERWKYANNDTLLALRTLRERFATFDDYLRFPYEQLLDKVGMEHTFLETDWQGDFILSSQVWTTARDLARLGVLHLNNGVWNGEQILPENWLSYISSPAPAQPPAAAPGYGAQWWLYNERFPELPNDTIAARGNRGQFLVIIPSRNLVIVRRGYDIAGEPGFNEHDFTRDVLRALAL